MTRDKLREEDYFRNRYKKDVESLIEDVSDYIRLRSERGEGGKGLNVCHICICCDTLRQFYSGYSLGLEKAELLDDNMFENYYNSMKLSWEADVYEDILYFLSISIIYDKKLEEIEEVVELLKMYDYKDFVLDSMVQYFLPTREVKYDGLQFVKDYKSLRSVIKNSKIDKVLAIEELKKYLDKEWLKTQTEGIISNRDHLSETQYRGYWCLEAVALVKMLELDDSNLKECKYYPYDLIH